MTGSFSINPAFCSPMKAMNRPMPTAMPPRRLGLIASTIAWRRPESVTIRNSTPDTKTTPKATCQGSGGPSQLRPGAT